jgi:hypothetical protein
MMPRYLKEDHDRNRCCSRGGCFQRKSKEFEMSFKRYSESNLPTRKEKREEGPVFEEPRTRKRRMRYSSDDQDNPYHPCNEVLSLERRKCGLLTSYSSEDMFLFGCCEHSINWSLKGVLQDWILFSFLSLILLLQITSCLGKFTRVH